MKNLCFTVIIGIVTCFLEQFAYGQDQSLEGQMTALATELRELVGNDRLVPEKKLRLDKVSSVGIPDGNFEQRIEVGMAGRLADVLDDSSRLLVKIEVGYLVSDTKTNKDKRIIQITAKVLERGRQIDKKQKEAIEPIDQPSKVEPSEVEPSKDQPLNEEPLKEVKQFKQEVNNSSDIARLVGATLAIPDTEDHKNRLETVESFFENPQFVILNQTRIHAVGEQRYAVELRKKIGGRGDSIPVPPASERGMAFASIGIGDTYEIVLYNYAANTDAIAKVEIDGLDAVNTFNIDTDANGQAVQYPGYFVPRAKNGMPGVHAIPGWMHTVKPGSDNVFQFVVNELGKGAATAKKVRGKTGVITVSFYEAFQPGDSRTRTVSPGETAKGVPLKVDYELKPVEFADSPTSVISIRYSR